MPSLNHSIEVPRAEVCSIWHSEYAYGRLRLSFIILTFGVDCFGSWQSGIYHTELQNAQV